MREILFRGKRVDNGAWETGSLLVERMNTSEQQVMVADKMTGYPTLVIPETVGQYTGLKDKNGTRIFEGDIVETKYGRLCEVVWYSSNRYQSWDLKPLETKHRYPDAYDVWASNNLEVIGNVYDNQEILNGEREKI